MGITRISFCAFLPGLTLWAFPVYAGMPTFSLTEIAQFRLSTISFFLMVYLLASLAIFLIWNFLRKDFQRLPKLSYPKALAFVFLWGVAFHLLLVMIAGTRELMTPEAWEKAGAIHKLSPDKYQQKLDMRRHKVDVLKQELWRFADTHDGQFPPDRVSALFPEEVWRTPTGDAFYVYISIVNRSSRALPLAYEPENYGQERMTLLTSGQIELLPIKSIQALSEKKAE